MQTAVSGEVPCQFVIVVRCSMLCICHEKGPACLNQAHCPYPSTVNCRTSRTTNESAPPALRVRRHRTARCAEMKYKLSRHLFNELLAFNYPPPPLAPRPFENNTLYSRCTVMPGRRQWHRHIVLPCLKAPGRSCWKSRNSNLKCS